MAVAAPSASPSRAPPAGPRGARWRWQLGDRIALEPLTLSAADLLLTKLQIVELNRKDLQDMVGLLATHVPAETDGAGRIGLARLLEVTRGDWGLYTTLTDNLRRIGGEGGPGEDGPEREIASERAGRIREALVLAPKTAGFRMRARVGRAKRWYELPEEG